MSTPATITIGYFSGLSGTPVSILSIPQMTPVDKALPSLEKIKVATALMAEHIQANPRGEINTANFYSKEIVNAMEELLTPNPQDQSKLDDLMEELQTSTLSLRMMAIKMPEYTIAIERITTSFIAAANQTKT